LAILILLREGKDLKQIKKGSGNTLKNWKAEEIKIDRWRGKKREVYRSSEK
jgi:hypothetical protein